MSTQTQPNQRALAHLQSWEQAILPLAYLASAPSTTAPSANTADPALLDRAYAYCEQVTAIHSRTFSMATALLPPCKRRAVRALYAFCRVSDDIVDTQDASAEQCLADWRRRVLAAQPPADDLVAFAWADARRRWRIPRCCVEQLLDGVARDLYQKRYRTFDELARYAYGVASTVGLMAMHIVGYAGVEAIPYAVKLGVALQLTNILRDVGEDWRLGRLYLPADDLAAFGVSEEDVAAGRVDQRWRALMRFEIARNRRLYAEARPGIAFLDRDGRIAIAAAGGLYSAILDDIEAHDYDVFGRRAHVGGWHKLRRLPAIWWSNRRDLAHA